MVNSVSLRSSGRIFINFVHNLKCFYSLCFSVSQQKKGGERKNGNEMPCALLWVSLVAKEKIENSGKDAFNK